MVPIDETNIALAADRDHKFYTAVERLNETWLNLNDEHVMVWFQMESFPQFIKLWGHVQGTLKKGQEYTLAIQKNWINVTSFGGSTYVYLSEVNKFGGKGRFLGLVFVISACTVCLMIVIFIICYLWRIKDQDLYSTTNLSWD